jgi:hypothetical protein
MGPGAPYACFSRRGVQGASCTNGPVVPDSDLTPVTANCKNVDGTPLSKNCNVRFCLLQTDFKENRGGVGLLTDMDHRWSKHN